MPMRVIAGIAKGRPLKMVPGDSTRPVMDRVKESLFNILGARIMGSRFLDLFAGTGSVGIEALSRGATQAYFIDQNSQAVRTIQENLTVTKLGEKAIIRKMDAFGFLKNPPMEPFDYIYVAPPQYKDLWIKSLEILDTQAAWTPSSTTVIVQIDPKEKKPVDLKRLEPFDERKYGHTLLWFFRARLEETSVISPVIEE